MWSKKEGTQKSVVSTQQSQSRYVFQRSQTVTVETTQNRLAALDLGNSINATSSILPADNRFVNSFLRPRSLTANSNSFAADTDATVLFSPTYSSNGNLNYQSPPRNAIAYRSFQQPKTSNCTTNTIYHGALPAASQALSSSTSDDKIKVVKSGKFYDSNCVIPTYETHSKNRGEVLIINNIMFKDKGYRRGAEKDDKNLKSLFKQMGFIVHLEKDLSVSRMQSSIKNFSKRKSLKDVDIAVVVVMSHGTNKNQSLGGTEVFGLDEKGILVDDLMKYFTDEECKHLVNKPKIFIFQCCRGDNEEFIQKDATRVPEKVAPLKDALIAYSCLPGFVSHRDPVLGTWYISKMCEVFSKHAHEYHVEDLLKIVDTEVAKIAKGLKQTTHYENKGFKRCYLHPK